MKIDGVKFHGKAPVYISLSIVNRNVAEKTSCSLFIFFDSAHP